MPARPDCVIRTAPPGPGPAGFHATTSSISATAAAVASAIKRDVSTPDISTGSTSSAAKLRLPSETSRCSPVKASRSTPIVASHCRLRCATLSCGKGCVKPTNRGSNHSVTACAA